MVTTAARRATSLPRSLLAGQRALVTGANSGIGKASAIKLGQAGADVVVNYISDEAAAKEVVREVEKFGVRAFAHRADVSREDEVSDLLSSMIEQFGTIDILVANAGIQIDSAFEEMTLAEWQRVLDVNLTGQFLCARGAIREFLRRGVVPEVSSSAGKVVCISSVHQIIPWAGHANYTVSKSGVQMLMETLSQEFAPRGIRVNAVAPGAIRTPLNQSAWDTPEAEKALVGMIPYGRIGDPDDIATATALLASDLMDYVVGSTLFVDGGMKLFPEFAHGG